MLIEEYNFDEVNPRDDKGSTYNFDWESIDFIWSTNFRLEIRIKNIEMHED